MAGAESASTSNGVVMPLAASMPVRFPSTSPTFEYRHSTRTPLQPAGDGGPPTKWSPSSAVITNSVLAGVIPCAASARKNVPNAAFSALSWRS